MTYANKALRPGCELWATDVCVPISRLAECILETKKDLKQSFLIAPLVGHVGDGNFHTLIATPRAQYARAQEFSGRLVRRALELDGTASGEHGIGLTKRAYMAEEHGPALEWMRRLKALFDPDNLLNPGKIL